MTLKSSIAAGAAIGAAQDIGCNQLEQAHAAVIAADEVAAHERATAKKADEQVDTLCLMPKDKTEDALEPARTPCPPYQPPGEGIVRKLARWLNLK